MMSSNTIFMLCIANTAAFAAAPFAGADAVVDLYEDRALWEAAVGDQYTTIGFDEYPSPMPIDDEYEHLGVTFSDFQFSFGPGWDSFPNDGYGLDSYDSDLVFTFDTPRRALAADFPGGFAVILYRDGEHVWHDFNNWGGEGVGHFEGLISSEAFDEVHLIGGAAAFTIDDLHFGLPVPAPAVLPVLALGCLVGSGRRRGGE